MGLLKQFISGFFNSGRYSNAKIDEDSLLDGLSNESICRRRLILCKRRKRIIRIPYHKATRFVMIISTLVVAVTFILHYSFVYIKEVILYPNSNSVNDSGALMFQKSLGREYGVFLFNTSDVWADTGISVSKNDLLRISVSGAFHSSANDLIIDTEENTPNPEVRWVGQKLRNVRICKLPQAQKRAFCLNPKGGLGSVLYAVVPKYDGHEPNGFDSGFVNVWKPKTGKRGQIVCHSGRLLLAINDIYFDNPISFMQYWDNEHELRFGKPFPKDSILSSGSDYSKMLYEDNLGQLLICVEIQHRLMGPAGGFLGSWFNPRTPYRWLETSIERSFSDHNLVFISILISFFCILLYVLWLAAIVGIWVFITLVGVYLLFLLMYGIHRLTLLRRSYHIRKLSF